MEDKTCTNVIGHAPDGKPIYCEQPAPYLVVTTSPALGWAVVDYHCAGCASHALSRADTLEAITQAAATKID